MKTMSADNATNPVAEKTVTLSDTQVQGILKQLRVFKHDLNNKMTVIGNASGFAKTKPELAPKLLDIISNALGPNNTVLEDYTKLLEYISKELQVK